MNDLIAVDSKTAERPGRDPDGRELAVTLDGAGRVTAVPPYVARVDYDEQGLPSEEQYGNGVATSYTYDARLRLATLFGVGPANLVHPDNAATFVAPYGDGMLDWYRDAIANRDRSASSVTFAMRFLAAMPTERAEVRDAWDPTVEWALPNPWRLSCTADTFGSPRERILTNPR